MVRIDDIVLGTLLNDFGDLKLMSRYGMSLRKELFYSKQHQFVFGIIERMYNDGKISFTPSDVFDYATNKGVRFGDAGKFCSFMCSLATSCYAPNSFAKNLKELVSKYIKRVNVYGK